MILPHFRNSIASRSLYEPIYKSLYFVIITPPPALQNKQLNYGMLYEHIIKIDGLPTDEQVVPQAITQPYFQNERSFASPKLQKTYADVKITFTRNLDRLGDDYVYRMIRQWSNLIHNPQTGERMYKIDYSGKLYVAILDRKLKPIREFLFFPAFVSAIVDDLKGLDSKSEDLAQIEVTFRCDDWIEKPNW